MPILKNALKKQRVDKRRAAQNIPVRGRVKSAIKAARANPTPESVAQFYSAVDHAVAKKLVAKRTASRLKSRLVKFAKTKAK
jgi:ribosomal protein S20